jgi:hypothetical protein
MGTLEHTVTVEGGQYKNKQTGEVVKATRWQKDGDHPLVVRYPIERREYKGLLEVSPKEKHTLVYGDWVVETESDIYVVPAGKFGSVYEEVKQDAAEAAPIAA